MNDSDEKGIYKVKNADDSLTVGNEFDIGKINHKQF